jgi:L-asparagine transporter-like permease
VENLFQNFRNDNRKHIVYFVYGEKSMKKKEKGLSAWQLTMMAVGTVIGGSFFLGSAVAIHAAGPAVVISYIIGGVLVYFILYALSEMTVANPDAGSFRTFAAEAFGNGTGFVVGWVYWTGMVLAMSSEATAVSILMREWVPNLSIPILGSSIIVIVTMLNLLGASKLSKLESGLAAIKILAIISFIIIAILLILGLFPNKPAIGTGELVREPLAPGGIKGIAGSMLLVLFAYAGFEIIGLASSEAENPKETVPKAINYTVICLVSFYILSTAVLLPLISTSAVNEDTSPMVAALNRSGIGWAGTAINAVLITAILSTMLAAMFGLGRMMRSLADEGQAPKWLKDNREVPYRGILFSGLAMLLGLWFGLLFPKVYLFLISSGGFAMLFTYTIVVASHIRFRKKHGCPSEGKCYMRGFPYSSLFTLLSLFVIIISMPFVPGQTSGLIAGAVMVVVYACAYLTMKFIRSSASRQKTAHQDSFSQVKTKLSAEFSDELTDIKKEDRKKK